jgi:hypothetical protein
VKLKPVFRAVERLRNKERGAFVMASTTSKKRGVAVVDLDDESPRTLIELGHFLDAAEDDAKTAETCFAKAITLCKRQLKEALLGHAKVLSELERRPEALARSTEAYWLQSRNGKPARGRCDEEILEQLGAL